jgi:hypothetical protein
MDPTRRHTVKRAWKALVLTAAAAAMARPAAAQVPAGGEIVVNTYTTGSQDDAAVAVTRDGRFVVVWESPQDDFGDAVVTRSFAASGAPLTGERIVNGVIDGNQDDASVAVGRDGRFVVVWESPDTSVTDGIFGQRFDAAGAPVGAEFRVNTFTLGAEYAPSAAMLAGGGFVVTWSVFGEPGPAPDGSNGAVMARLYDAAGAPRGDEFVVNTYTPGYQNFGYAASSANGTFVITWQSRQVTDSNYDIFGQRFDDAGNRLGGEFRVNAATTGSQSSYPAAMADDGRFVVLWLGPDGDENGIFGRRFGASGAPLGDDFAVNTYTAGNQALATAASDARGDFVVTWYSVGQDGAGRGIFGQRFDAGGGRRGAEFAVSVYTTGDQNNAWVESDAVGNFVVVWQSPQDGAGTAVVARRFGGLFPAALEVDAAGNRVFEPGESVDVRPSWRNQSGAPQTFGGGLSDFTGPGGATYTIGDNLATYGTVADGATAACADCYRVSVDNPVPRPVKHWDATALEGVTPEAQGQRKPWTLHVGNSFPDVPASSPFYRFVETLLHAGVTAGCNASEYCPASAATRDQMSVFVLIAKEGAGYAPPACTTPVFDDVPASSPFCRFIEELARRGVVSGCGGGNYCPGDPVTRAQMAVFVLRTLDPALDPPACTTPVFADVPASDPFCRWIEELFRRGVVSGCGGGNYCPASSVTREQMAVFISATFSLTLYGP